MPAVEPMNAEELLALPDTDELRHAQVIEAELVVDAPAALHQRVVGDLRHGLQELWLVDTAARAVLISPRLPGFELPLSELFPPPE